MSPRLLLPHHWQTLLRVGALVGGCWAASPAQSVPCRNRALPIPLVGANVVDLAHPNTRRGFGRAASRATLDRLLALGLNAVVLPVEVHMASASAPSVYRGPLNDARLSHMIADAQARGFAVVLTVHLLVDDGTWRGDLTPSTLNLETFSRTYQKQLLQIADVAQARCATAISVALEFKSLSATPTGGFLLRGFMDAVRTRFTGVVTYSANWDEAAQVSIWDAADVVAVNAFWPLATLPGDDVEALTTAAVGVQERAGQIGKQHHKPVYFLEVGFKAVAATAVRPWEWPEEIDAASWPLNTRAQANAYLAHARAFRQAHAIAGLAFWVVPSDLYDDKTPWRYESPQGFSFIGKEAEGVVFDLSHSRGKATSPLRSVGHRAQIEK